MAALSSLDEVSKIVVKIGVILSPVAFIWLSLPKEWLVWHGEDLADLLTRAVLVLAYCIILLFIYVRQNFCRMRDCPAKPSNKRSR